MKQCNNRFGFTLIELIIVVSVVTFLSTVGIVVYRDYRQRQALETAAYDLATTIQLAKSRSISQVKPSSCGTLSLDGYRVNIPSLSGSEYTISAICEGNIFETKTFNLSKGIEFDRATTISPGLSPRSGIFFPILTLETQGGGDIVIESGARSATVSVDNVGTVRIEPL